MSRFRIFASDKPTLRFARVLPPCPREQAILDELRRRRAQRNGTAA